MTVNRRAEIGHKIIELIQQLTYDDHAVMLVLKVGAETLKKPPDPLGKEVFQAIDAVKEELAQLKLLEQILI